MLRDRAGDMDSSFDAAPTNPAPASTSTTTRTAAAISSSPSQPSPVAVSAPSGISDDGVLDNSTPSVPHQTTIVPASVAGGSLTYSTIMTMKVSVGEAALAAQLCELAETSCDETAVMTPGSAEEVEFQERAVRATELGDSLTRLCGGHLRAIAVFRQRLWSSHERFAIPERMENLRGLTDRQSYRVLQAHGGTRS